jgi:hypothetical protein
VIAIATLPSLYSLANLLWKSRIRTLCRFVVERLRLAFQFGLSPANVMAIPAMLDERRVGASSKLRID